MHRKKTIEAPVHLQPPRLNKCSFYPAHSNALRLRSKKTIAAKYLIRPNPESRSSNPQHDRIHFAARLRLKSICADRYDELNAPRKDFRRTSPPTMHTSTTSNVFEPPTAGSTAEYTLRSDPILNHVAATPSLIVCNSQLHWASYPSARIHINSSTPKHAHRLYSNRRRMTRAQSIPRSIPAWQVI